MSSVRFNDIWFVCPEVFRPPTSIPEYSDPVSDIGPVGQASLFRSNHPDRFSGSGLINPERFYIVIIAALFERRKFGTEK
jgi:hypothetical protein